MTNPQQTLALAFRALHNPASPLLLTNIHDPATASLALSHPHTTALATASFAIAASLGLDDPELTLEDNLAAISRIAARIRKEGRAEVVPLTCDLQDGYGERLGEVMSEVLGMGVVGCNIEDANVVDGKDVLVDVEVQVARIREVMRIAAEAGVSGFVINARTDCVLLGGTIEEAVRRGKKYLEAGACTVFVWGGKRGLRDEEVQTLVRELDGRVSVIYRKTVEGALSVRQIKDLGVARISMGPGLWREAMAAVDKELGRILEEYHI